MYCELSSNELLRNLPLRNIIHFDDYFLVKSLKIQNSKNMFSYTLFLPYAGPCVTRLDLQRFKIVVKYKVEKKEIYEVR